MNAVAVEARPVHGDRARQTAWTIRLSDCTLLVAAGFWALALHWTNPGAMTDFGLVPALPVVWFAAVGLVLFGFVCELRSSHPTTLRLAAHVVGLIVILHGTVPVLFSLPHYIWVYKHLGVVRALSVHGHTASSVDVYQSWPGFFAAATWLAKVSGVRDPQALVPWAQVFFNLAAVVELSWVFSALTVRMTTRWTAIMIFVLGNWVAQDYFAPQAEAFVLSLAFFGVVLTWLRADPEGRRPPRAALVAAIALFSVLVVSHPLTPYLVVASLALLTVTGNVRPKWLPAVLGAEALLYLLPRYGFVGHYHLFASFGDFFHNAQNNAAASGGLPGRLWTVRAARALSLTVWGLAAAGALRRWRQREPVIVPALLATAPVLLLFVGSYGGEAIFRVFLFSLPWSAFLAATLVEEALAWRPRLAFTATFGVLTALAVMFVGAFFGNESINQVWQSDLAGASWFYRHAPSGSTLVLAAPNFPVRDAANYAAFRLPDGEFEPNLAGDKRLRGTTLSSASLPLVESVVRAGVPAGGHAYLAIGKGERVYADEFELMPPGALDGLDAALATSPRWRLSFREGATAIYELMATGGGA